MVGSQQKVEDDSYAVAVKPVAMPFYAPASRGELWLMLAAGLVGLLVSVTFAAYVSAASAATYWLYVAAIALVLSATTLALTARSHFRRIEFLATANGLSVQLQAMSQKFEHEHVSKRYVAQLADLIPVARQYGDGLVAAGLRSAGADLVYLASSVDIDQRPGRALREAELRGPSAASASELGSP